MRSPASNDFPNVGDKIDVSVLFHRGGISRPFLKDPCIATVWKTDPKSDTIWYRIDEGWPYAGTEITERNSHSIDWRYGRSRYDFHRVFLELAYDPTQAGDTDDDI